MITIGQLAHLCAEPEAVKKALLNKNRRKLGQVSIPKGNTLEN